MVISSMQRSHHFRYFESVTYTVYCKRSEQKLTNIKAASFDNGTLSGVKRFKTLNRGYAVVTCEIKLF